MTTTVVAGIEIQSEHEKACEAISAFVYRYFEEHKIEVDDWHFEAAIARQPEQAPCMTIYASKPGAGRLAFTHTEPDGVVSVHQLAVK